MLELIRLKDLTELYLKENRAELVKLSKEQLRAITAVLDDLSKQAEQNNLYMLKIQINDNINVPAEQPQSKSKKQSPVEMDEDDEEDLEQGEAVEQDLEAETEEEDAEEIEDLFNERG